jgi:LacI family transcriptional regulator
MSGRAEQCRIAPATRQLILAEAGRLGVVVDQYARGLRLRQTLTIGLLIPDIANPFFANLACAVEKAARAHGYAVLLCDSQESTALEMESVNLLHGRRVDGMILAPVGEEHLHLLSLQQTGMPIVLVDRVFPEWEVPSVVSDNLSGARMAVNHLLACGHRRIGCVQGLPTSYSNMERLRGYKSALEDAGIRFDAKLVSGSDFTAESGYRSTLELCENPEKRPSALFALGSLLAFGAIRAIHECGLKVAADISVVSFDEQPWAQFLAPSLTTVAQPVEQLATQAVSMLLGAMKPGTGGKPTAGVRALPVELIFRESVRTL